MKVKRIVANIATPSVTAAGRFYRDATDEYDDVASGGDGLQDRQDHDRRCDEVGQGRV